MALETHRSIDRNFGSRRWFAAKALALLVISAAGRPSLAQGVVVSTETVTTLSASATRSAAGRAVTLTASVEAVHALAARGAVPGGFIDFYDESTARLLGRAEPSRPSVTVSDLTPGTHEVRAYYRGTSDFLPAIMQPSMSQAVMLHVLATPELALFVAYAGGGAVDLTVSVKVSRGGATPRGTIMFRDGEAMLAASVQLDSSGQARFMTSALTAGSHVFVVEYSGDAIYAAATATIPKLVHDTTTHVMKPFSKAARD